MKVPLKWLSEYVDLTLSPEELAQKLTMAGFEVTGTTKYAEDIVWEIDVTPNRPDCLSILGIAREIAALTDKPLKQLELDYPEEGPPIQEIASVQINCPDLCPRYCAGVILGVDVAPSPTWLQERLILCGIRPINNIVDAANYTELELGQPLHAFDLDKLVGRRIVVRKAFPGEEIRTLDERERKLDEGMLVIADIEKPVAIAGVIGGLESAVSQKTRNILIESANFDYANIRRTETSLKLRTEASLRFNKGLSPELPYYGLKRMMRLVLKLAGGKACRGVIDLYPGKGGAKPIVFDPLEVKRILGMEVPPSKIKKLLTSLGFDVKEIGPSVFSVLPPYWRTDIRLSVDLIEEVARLIGYEEIPMTRLRGEVPSFRPKPEAVFREKVRGFLISAGLQEIITHSLTSSRKLELVGATLGLKVLNPLSREQEYLRTSLRPGLLSTASLNLKHTLTVRLFEIGRVYLPRGEGLPEEREVAGVVLAGLAFESHWLVKKRGFDFYDAKGIVEMVLSGVGLRGKFKPTSDRFFLSQRQAAVFVGEEYLGLVGEVHPEIARAFEISVPVYLIELEIEKLPRLVSLKVFQPLPLYPEAIRDLAFIVDEDIPAEKVEEIIRSFPLVCLVEIFDVYSGPPVPAGKKSLAFHVRFRSPNRTLTEKEVDQVQEEIVRRLGKELGAVIRG